MATAVIIFIFIIILITVAVSGRVKRDEHALPSFCVLHICSLYVAT